MKSDNQWAISVEGLTFSYGEDLVLDDISFKVARKNLCALVGPNGSGKSTLVKCITGLLKPQAGTAEVNCSHHDKHHSIGYVPQRHFVAEQFPVSVYEAVSSGRILGQKKWFRLNSLDREIINHSIESVGLKDHTDCRLDELSGGQQQRVLIAKALAGEPDVLILDEPTAGVDAASQELFRNALTHTIEEHDTTVLLISHELSAVSDLVDQIIVLKNRILFDGTPEDLIQQGVSLGIHQHDLPLWLEGLNSKSKLEASK